MSYTNDDICHEEKSCRNLHLGMYWQDKDYTQQQQQQQQRLKSSTIETWVLVNGPMMCGGSDGHRLSVWVCTCTHDQWLLLVGVTRIGSHHKQVSQRHTDDQKWVLAELLGIVMMCSQIQEGTHDQWLVLMGVTRTGSHHK